MNRREFVAASVTASVAAAAAGSVRADARQGLAAEATDRPSDFPVERVSGRLKQSVCRWCYGGMSLDDLCSHAAKIGLKSVELLGEKEWSVPAKHGLTCALANGPTTIPQGWNRLEHHDKFVKESERLLPLVKEAGIPQMIVFSGNRAGQADSEGLKNCAVGLKRITPLAEKLGVTIVMELLNSKVDHHDYQCDHTAWGVELVKRVGSARFKLLYDIYHMQIMEGDVIRTVTENLEFINHFHTGGVPGRHELDGSQELQWATICRAIVEKGFSGYLAQEFIPTRDPMTSLREAFELCDV